MIRYFLERTWGGKNIDEALWRYAVITTRQPGAEHAPLHFLAGSMFSTDIHTVYEQLSQPVWMSHGVRGDFVDYRGKSLVEGRPNWRFEVLRHRCAAVLRSATAVQRGLRRLPVQGIGVQAASA